jgi:hypothetical protein
MATTLTDSYLKHFGGGRTHTADWTFTAGETGDPFEMPAASDRSVQMAGTFNGATVVLEGSNDGTNYVTLTDQAATALSFTSAGLRLILQPTRYIRPRVSSGSVTSVTISVVANRRV